MSSFTYMPENDLIEYIEGMFAILENWDYNITDLENRWTYICDDDGNIVYRRQAEVLAKRLENVHRKLDKEFYKE